MTKIKILETIRQGSFGGGETYLFNLVTRLNRDKFEPVVLSFSEGAMVEALKEKSIKTYVISTEKPFDISVYKQVFQILKKENIDLLHIHGTRAGTNTLIPTLFTKVKNIYTVHGWSYHTGNNALVTKSRIISEKFLTRFTNVTVCGSEADKKLGEQNCPGGKYRLIHNSIDPDLYDPQKPGKDIRKEFGFDENDFIISSIARLTFQKDPLTLIKAFNLFQAIHQNVKLLIAGGGELEEECKQLVHDLNLDIHVVFSPFRKDVTDVLRSIDVFVLPSLWEVIPLGLLEAMSFEKICVATKIPGTSEAVKNNENGFLFEKGNEMELAQKLEYIYLNRNNLDAIKQNARKTVVDNFNIKTLVKKNESLYLELMGE